MATDDETYTYNKRINRLAPVQEHRMILRAIDRGVPEERIAEALGLDAQTSGSAPACSTEFAPTRSRS